MPHQPHNQQRIAASLQRALGAGRLAHGLLFIGRDPALREQAARALACGILCDAGMRPWGCGVCVRCHRVLHGSHADVHVLMAPAEAVRRGLQEPDGKKKPSEQILVDDVRALGTRLRMTSYEGGARVAIVLDADRMNPSAQNALLKTLEEPGERTTLILTVSDASGLLPTVISRCLRLRLSPQESGPPAEGSPLFDALLSSDVLQRLDAAEAIGRDRGATEHALAASAALLMEVARSAARGAATPISWQEASRLLDQLALHRRAFQQNANAQLALEELLLSPRRPA